MQIPEHVAGGEAGDQEFFRIVAGPIAAKARIAGALNLRLAFRGDDVIAPVSLVAPGAFAIVAGPIYVDLIGVLLHCLFLILRACSRFHASETFCPAAMLSTTS